ncbi:hypothetical protein [Qaidamihabitans albus]|uniref:hypothetical protein n=1 Tax=Qaidamihabitans albus TaxID=2795733 RepID=UPI0018F13CCA|nr:hypothetical protein [Qaidamihabitans albus]
MRTDLPVLAMLVLCWLMLTVAAWAHLATGLVLAVVIGVHLRTRWPQVRALTRGTGRSMSVRRLVRRAAHRLLLAAAAAMIASGLARWAGVPAQDAWHGTSSYTLLGVVTVHLLLVRRRLWIRLRGRQARNENPGNRTS